MHSELDGNGVRIYAQWEVRRGLDSCSMPGAFPLSAFDFFDGSALASALQGALAIHVNALALFLSSLAVELCEHAGEQPALLGGSGSGRVLALSAFGVGAVPALGLTPRARRMSARFDAPLAVAGCPVKVELLNGTIVGRRAVRAAAIAVPARDLKHTAYRGGRDKRPAHEQQAVAS